MQSGRSSGLSFAGGINAAALSMDTLGMSSRAAISILDGVGSSLMRVGRTASVVSLVTGLVGVSAVRTGFEWRKQWNMSRAVTAGTADEMKNLEKLVFKLGSETKFTVTEVAGAVEFLGKAGNTAAEQMSLLPTVLDLSTAADMELPDVADLITNIVQGLQIDPSRIGEVGDMLTATFLNSNVTLRHLADTMKKFGPITATLGLDLADVVTAIGMLGNAGIQGSESGVHLRRMMVNLSDTMSQMRTGVVEQLGLSWEDLDVQTRGFIPVMKTLRDILLDSEGKLKEETKGFAGRLFGTRAMSTALALLGQLGDGYDDLNEKVRNSAGVTEQTADEMIEGLEPFYRLQAAWTNLQVQIAESGVLDTIADLADKIAEFLIKMADASGETKRLSFGLVILSSVAGPAIFLLGGLISALANIGKMFLFVGSSISFFLSPIGILAAAMLAVVGAAGYMAINGVESFRNLFDGSSPLISAVADAVLGLVGLVVSVIDGDWTMAWGHVKDIVANVAVIVVMVLSTLLNAAVDILKNLTHHFVEHWDQIVNGILNAFEWLTTETEGFMVLFALFMIGGVQKIVNRVIRAFTWMVNGILKALVWLTNTSPFVKVWGWLWTWMQLISSIAMTWIIKHVTRFAMLFLAPFKAIATRLLSQLGRMWKWMASGFMWAFRNIVAMAVAFGNRLMTVLRAIMIKVQAGWAAIRLILTNPVLAASASIVAIMAGMIVLLKDELWAGMKGIGNIIKWSFATLAEIIARALDTAILGLYKAARTIGGVVGFNMPKVEILPEGAIYGMLGFGGDYYRGQAGGYGGGIKMKEWQYLQQLGDFERQGVIYKMGSGRSLGDTGGDIMAKLKGFAVDAEKTIVNAFGKVTGAFRYVNDWFDKKGFNPISWVTAIAKGDWERVGEMGAAAIQNSIGAALTFIGNNVFKPLLVDALVPATKAGLKTLLGVVGYAMKELDQALVNVDNAVDIDPEQVKNRIYQILEDIGIPMRPEYDPNQDPVDQLPPDSEIDTPEERKKHTIDFINNLVADLKEKLANLFQKDEEGNPIAPQGDLRSILAGAGIDLDLAEETMDRINDLMDITDDYDPTDLTGGGGSGGGVGSGVSRSLSGTLSDLTLRVFVQIGDQPFEDAVVASMFSAQRAGRLQGLTP